MEFFLRGLVLLSVVALSLSLVSMPPPRPGRPYTISPLSRFAKLPQIKGAAREIEENAFEPSIPALPGLYDQEERVKRSPQKAQPAVYRPREHRPRLIHPTYKVPQTTARSYRF